jgi:hypothetical protein
MSTDASVLPWELTETERERVREMSKLMFGNADRLDVAIAVASAPDGVVSATDLQWKLQLANNRVGAQLRVLQRAGLLQEAPVSGPRRMRMFVRVESPFWDLCRAWYAEWSGVGASD